MTAKAYHGTCDKRAFLSMPFNLDLQRPQQKRFAFRYFAQTQQRICKNQSKLAHNIPTLCKKHKSSVFCIKFTPARKGSDCKHLQACRGHQRIRSFLHRIFVPKSTNIVQEEKPVAHHVTAALQQLHLRTCSCNFPSTSRSSAANIKTAILSSSGAPSSQSLKEAIAANASLITWEA
jgi:hypothetical protein